MSETWEQDGTAGFAGQAAANDAPTAGALLRRAREAAGLHVAALAVSLKVPVRKLEALEEDRWDLLSDAVFVRALACTVCRTLKIDPQPVLDRLPQTGAPRLIETGEGINAPFRAPSDGAGPSWLDQLSKPVFLAVFALLLGALVLILLPSMQRADTVAAPGSPQPVISPPRAAGNPAPPVEPAPAVSSAGFVQPVAAVAAPWVPVAPAPAAGVSTVAPADGTAADPAAAADAPAAPASGILVFRARSPSWVEVRDAKGVVAVRRLLAAGESAGVSGALPLQVVIGRVDATELEVRGKPFDLRPVSRDNVARFEVK